MDLKLRLFFIVLALLLFAIDIKALSVTLSDPANNTVFTTKTITLKCKVDYTDQTLTSLTLYTNITGWAANETNKTDVTNNVDYTFTTINNLPNGTYFWNCLSANATNQTFSKTDNYFTINFNPNTSPYLNVNVPNQNWNEDSSLSNVFDLDNYFSDPENTQLTYTVSGNNNIAVTINSNNQVSLSQPTNWYGVETVVFRASDGTLTNVSNSIILNVSNINDAPNLTKNIPDLSWAGNINKSIDLEDYFTDPDGDTLGYSSTSVENIKVYINNNTGTATFSPNKDWGGNKTIKFTAYDNKGGKTESNLVTLRVSFVSAPDFNEPPIINTYTPLLDPILEENSSQLFKINASDPDNDKLKYKWYLDNTLLNSTSNQYNYSNTTLGTHNITVTVSDDVFDTSRSWKISVIVGRNKTFTSTSKNITFDIDLTNKTSSTIKKNESESITFTLDSKIEHKIIFSNVTNDTVTLTIMSTPINITLKLNEAKQIDLDADDKPEIIIKLNSIENKEAKITIEKITPKKNFNTLIIVISIISGLIILVFLVYIFREKILSIKLPKFISKRYGQTRIYDFKPITEQIKKESIEQEKAYEIEKKEEPIVQDKNIDKIVNYIKSSLEIGTSYNEIKMGLLKKGYTREQIREGFNRVVK